MNIEELTNIFTYHPPHGDQEVRYDIIRGQAKSLAIHIEKWCPRSREKSLAITKLQECVMMANAAIAIHEPVKVASDDARPATSGEMPTLDSLPDPPAHHEVSDEDRAAEQAEKEEELEAAEEQAEREAEIPPEVLNEARDDEQAAIEAEEAGADIRDENVKAEQEQRDRQTEGEL